MNDTSNNFYEQKSETFLAWLDRNKKPLLIGVGIGALFVTRRHTREIHKLQQDVLKLSKASIDNSVAIGDLADVGTIHQHRLDDIYYGLQGERSMPLFEQYFGPGKTKAKQN